jgi:spore maturation protein CgeB
MRVAAGARAGTVFWQGAAGMKYVVFGLSVSSSWGNGHATLWRGLCAALVRRGHYIVFFERDTPYYRKHRDLTELAGCRLVLYDDWSDARADATAEIADADAVIVTSYCADALAAEELALDAAALRVFYDLDTGVTLERAARGERVDYIGERGLRDYDVVLSYTGGSALHDLQRLLGARRVAPLYGSVDPAVHAPVAPVDRYRCELSYLATHAADRHALVMELFITPARTRPQARFIIAGPLYPPDFPWQPNIHYIEHVPPRDHPVFYCSSRATLNLTRAAMARTGYCPSGRLFEAAAAGVPLISDSWDGLEAFFTPGEEIIVVRRAADVIDALSCADAELERIAAAARARTLEQHTADQRAQQLEAILDDVAAAATSGARAPTLLEVEHVGHHSGGGRG